MRVALKPVLMELRSIVGTVREEADTRWVGPVLVTGMLAEQLARQLGQDAAHGAVQVDASRLEGSSVLVHVIAGDPGVADDDLVRRADHARVPVILIQLWPQASWTTSYVLTPFVVECRAGEGFPMPEISARIVEAVEHPVELARRVPVLEEKTAEAVVGTTIIRSAVLASTGKGARAARPLITLEQIKMLIELRKLEGTVPLAAPDALKAVAPFAVAAVVGGFAFREAANAAKRVLPAAVVDATVAAAGTWVVGAGLRRLSGRSS